MPTYFFKKNILCDRCLHNYHLYIQKMLTYREMLNFQKLGLFCMFLYTFARNCVTPGARKKPIKYMFCFIYRQQCIIIISSRKMCGFMCSVFKKIISNNAIPTFQEVGGVTRPRIFCRWHKNFSWYCVNYHKSE